jgi:hypothetical protein
MQNLDDSCGGVRKAGFALARKAEYILIVPWTAFNRGKMHLLGRGQSARYPSILRVARNTPGAALGHRI